MVLWETSGIFLSISDDLVLAGSLLGKILISCLGQDLSILPTELRGVFLLPLDRAGYAFYFFNGGKPGNSF